MNSQSKDRNARFAGRRFYVTGAASGIGLATARRLVEGGAALALIDVNAPALDEAVAELGGTAIAIDLRDGDAIDTSVEHAARAMGGIDGVINCAGVATGALIENLSPADWTRVIDVNLTAPYRVCHAAVPHMRKAGKGAIVNISSGVGIRPTAPGAAAYAASKGGLIALTKALALDLAPHIRANVVCPGFVDTPMNAHIIGGEREAGFVAQYAMRRAADPRELADAIAFLASDEASYITGSTLVTDGGRIFY